MNRLSFKESDDNQPIDEPVNKKPFIDDQLINSAVNKLIVKKLSSKIDQPIDSVKPIDTKSKKPIKLLSEYINKDKSPFNNLPSEIFDFYIFEYLTIDELFKLRSINKRLKSIVDQYKIRELIFVYSNDNLKDRWFYTNKYTDFRFNLNYAKINLLFKLESTLASTLRILKIDFLERIDLELINNLKELIQLEIKVYYTIYFNENYTDQVSELINELDDNKIKKKNRKLCLSKLKIFKILANFEIELDFPNLIALELSDSILADKIFHKIKINHLSKIKYLKICCYHHLDSIFKNNQFNLDYLECVNIEIDKIKFMLDNFRSKEYVFNLANLDDNLKYLIKSTNHKFIYKNIHLNDIKIFEQLKSINKNQLTNEMLINYYDKLGFNLNDIQELNYNQLINQLKFNLPIDFFTKFTNINKLIIENKIDNSEFLIDFIKQSSNLYDLLIHNSNLNNLNFYNQLPEISSIINLVIKDKNQLKINFRFISRMFNLIDFRTDQDIILDEFNLNKLKDSEEIELIINGKNIKIIRVSEFFTINDSNTRIDRNKLIKFIYN